MKWYGIKMKQLTYKHTRYTCYRGYITQAIIVNLAPILFTVFREQYGISFEALGRLTLINFFTQMLVDILAVKFADKIGYRKLLVWSSILSVAGFVLLGVMPLVFPFKYFSLAFATVMYAIGSGLIEVLVSPLVDMLPTEAKEANMSLLHAFYCWGSVLVVVVTTLLLKVLGSGLWFIIPILWGLIPFYNIFMFWRVPIPDIPPEEKKLPLKKLFASKIFLSSMLLMLCAGASELSMAQWASMFAEDGLKISKVMGDLLGPCMFAVTMGIGRTVYGIWGNHIKLLPALAATSTLCICCYLAATLSQNSIIALLGCVFCGFSISLMWPGVLSFSSGYHPMGGTPMFALLAMCGDIGCSVGPWITGAVADIVPEYGLRAGLLAAIIFPVIMLIGSIIFIFSGRKLKKK